MSVNGISNANSTAQSTYTKSTTESKDTSTKESSSTYGKDAAAVYEASSVTKKDNSALIAQLKADSDARVQQMQNLVKDMFAKQGKAVNNSNDMWKLLASGNFTVDAKTAADAKAAISEDGYWGVSQTSDRIFEFAKALSGGDSEKMDNMLKAFKKGFKEATKAWGKELPGISSKTYDAVIKKFDDYKTETKKSATE